jgi:hypothetical protein
MVHGVLSTPEWQENDTKDCAMQKTRESLDEIERLA